MKPATRSKPHDPPSILPHEVCNTLQSWIDHAADCMTSAPINLENGLQKPYLEAEYLAHHALSLCFSDPEHALHDDKKPLKWRKRLQKPPPPEFPALFADFLAQRLEQRLPAAYITGEAPFAGRRFAVNPHVLIPRSRIENLLDDPEELLAWLGRKRLPRILDLGTGSGCLAISFALAYPEAHVDASDISTEALAVAAENRRRFKLEKRMHLIHTSLFDAMQGRRYPLIVSNPPYVTHASMASLPTEYRHEPAIALDGGVDGLAIVEPLVRQAASFLSPNGALICEVGDETEAIIRARWPDFPVAWIYFHFGASGVFIARRADLRAWARETPLDRARENP